jgi:hypothetical protein
VTEAWGYFLFSVLEYLMLSLATSRSTAPSPYTIPRSEISNSLTL